jgi:hypothetical protein
MLSWPESSLSLSELKKDVSLIFHLCGIYTIFSKCFEPNLELDDDEESLLESLATPDLAFTSTWNNLQIHWNI